MKEGLAALPEDWREHQIFPSYEQLAALLDDGVSAAPHEPNEQQ